MSHLDDDVIRVVSWNIEHNGVERDGSDHRWHLAMDVLASLQPHILLRQELTRADLYGRRIVWAEAARLGGLVPFLADATPESANPTGVYINRDLLEPTEFFEHATGMWHPICNPVVRLKGVPTKLSLASFHLCSFDPDRRLNEARRLTTLGKPGMAAIIGGDCNSYAHTQSEAVSLPDWSEVEDRSHFEHRTVEWCGERVSDTRPDHVLAGAHHGRPPVFVELGQYAATRLSQAGALAPTASLWRKDQGPMQRIDRIYATPQVAEALTSLEVIVSDDIREASDHCPVVATFRLTALRRALAPATQTAA
ncbi:endonuclease/exonuclease/phosphatase family protein [Streptomyces inhibens]|uniref:endonuclease/exonuclease/phosphatase family protein n=1 Tax=Streptomyces inhibens TaxID=2293571 RepID=UPI001EE74307|nr:endonuclease/exonuclease/phosphatase family protein [Streptomyces inhibens]UKY49231.1 endonuclease/exonuclease/phosphatase family protein [Streptomyces inhibens]